MNLYEAGRVIVMPAQGERVALRVVESTFAVADALLLASEARAIADQLMAAAHDIDPLPTTVVDL